MARRQAAARSDEGRSTADAPTKPFGGTEEIAISGDGKTVVYCAKSESGKDAWSTNDDLWSVPLDGSHAPQRLTAANNAWDGGPAFSPDGKTLAYLAMARPGFEADRRRIVLLDWATKKTRVVADSLDRSPDEIAWAQDGKSIYAAADNLGQRALFRIDVASGKVSTVADVGWITHILPIRDGVAYLRNTFTSPDEIYARTGSEHAITHHNDARVAAIEWGAYEQFTFKGAHGDEVHGFLMRPPGHKGQKIPVALLIHGGPQGSFGNEFHYRWNAADVRGPRLRRRC